MYRNKDFVERSKKLADEIIKIERERYRPYYEAVLKFVRASKTVRIIVSGTIAVNSFLDNRVMIDNIVNDAIPFILYTDKPTALSADLVSFIYKTVPEDTVDRTLLMSTPILGNSEYTIRLTSRLLASINLIGEYRHKNLLELIRPVIIDGISVVPPEVLLIDIYRRIFTADKKEEQDELCATEKKIFQRFTRDVKTGKVSGGIEMNDIHNSHPVIVSLRKSIGSKLTEYGKSLLVGRQAFSETASANLVGLQYCTALTEEEITAAFNAGVELAGEKDSPEEVEKFNAQIEELATSSIKIEPVANLYSLSMPVDPRLRRYRFVVKASHKETTKKITLLDVFTAGQYDIIARHPYTILRFIFVDLWTIRLISKLGEIAEQSAAREIDSLLKLAVIAHAKITPLDDDYKKIYFGSYVSDEFAKHIAKGYAKRDNSQIIYPHVVNALN